MKSCLKYLEIKFLELTRERVLTRRARLKSVFVPSCLRCAYHMMEIFECKSVAILCISFQRSNKKQHNRQHDDRRTCLNCWWNTVYSFTCVCKCVCKIERAVGFHALLYSRRFLLLFRCPTTDCLIFYQ